jgi:hypothetical protein
MGDAHETAASDENGSAAASEGTGAAIADHAVPFQLSISPV